jgi:hypothetical protein
MKLMLEHVVSQLSIENLETSFCWFGMLLELGANDTFMHAKHGGGTYRAR